MVELRWAEGLVSSWQSNPYLPGASRLKGPRGAPKCHPSPSHPPPCLGLEQVEMQESLAQEGRDGTDRAIGA